MILKYVRLHFFFFFEYANLCGCMSVRYSKKYIQYVVSKIVFFLTIVKFFCFILLTQVFNINDSN